MANLLEAFTILRCYKMKLNPLMCPFGVESRKFLGFMVFEQGIEANTKKVEVVVSMLAPRNTNEVQRLAGQVAALNRFIA